MTACHRLLLALVLMSPGLPAAELQWDDVPVRVYHAALLSDAEETHALNVAARILAAADVAPRWVHCHLPQPADACASPTAKDERVIRIVRSSRPTPEPSALPLGEAFVDPSREATFATVHLERVALFAERTRVPRATVLGRAIAHELVHLLTASSAHAPVGLMRPVWTATALPHEAQTLWTLDARTIATLRTGRGPEARVTSR